MSEEAADTTTTETTQTDGQTLENTLPPKVETNPETKTNGQEDYQGRVDLSTLPEDIRAPVEARINTITKKLGLQARKFGSQIQERDDILRQQSEIIAELQSGMGKVVDHLHTKSIADEEANARQLLREAHTTGDTEAFITANERLAEIKARKIAMQNQPRPKQEQAQQKQPSYRSASEMADDAVNDGDIDPIMGQTVKAWQAETDERGQPLRPWAVSRAQQGQDPTTDARYRRAVTIAAEIFDDDPESGNPFAGRSVSDKLAEVDRRMGITRNQGGQNVMAGGQLTNTRKSSKITLTPEAQKIALRYKFAGPKGSDADHLEAYRKQIEKVNSRKGAR